MALGRGKQGPCAQRGEFDPQKSPVERLAGAGEATVTSVCVEWFDSVGPTSRVWDAVFAVPLAVAWLECALCSLACPY